MTLHTCRFYKSIYPNYVRAVSNSVDFLSKYDTNVMEIFAIEDNWGTTYKGINFEVNMESNIVAIEISLG